jgi:hypothetical protein
MNRFRMLACLLVSGAATACSSGSPAPEPQPGNSGPPGQPGVSPTPESSKYSGGYLYGSLYLDDASNTEYPIQVILSEDGRFRAQQLGPYGYPLTWLLLRGSFELHGRTIDGEGIAIADPGKTWSGGESKTGLTISGTLDQPTNADQGKLLITVSMASGDSGRIEAEFAVLSPYGYGSDLERLAGSWIAEQGDNGSWYADPYGSADPPLPPPMSVRIIVGLDGAFTGTDDGGCAMAGRFSLIDTRFSVWALEYTIRQCDREGDYSGHALGDNYWYSTRSLSFSADDGSRSQALEFWQQ